ncbi:MAG: imidazole glycerol phosphate synthase subunit HisH [Candidatus Bathyarchaeia archaeon]
MTSVSIIDYGVGNLKSIKKAIENFGISVVVTRQASTVKNSHALVLPGVGAFREAIQNLKPLKNVIEDFVKNEKPILGICLGLQLLFSESWEGGYFKGLNLLKGSIVKLPENLKVPHIGWNKINIIRNNPLVDSVENDSYVYFAHSYFASELDQETIIAYTNYGVDFPSIVSSKRIYATQFHPEKSGKVGLRILKNFIKIVKEVSQ